VRFHIPGLAMLRAKIIDLGDSRQLAIDLAIRRRGGGHFGYHIWIPEDLLEMARRIRRRLVA
jgi:hypothetical protein